jgi:RNA polymerase sigma factor FliA
MGARLVKQKDQTVQKLWKRYVKGHDVELRNELVVHYSHLVHTHAARLSRKLPAQISYDEICSAAFDGLIEAVEGYDPMHKAKFETFCQQRIAGAVMDWLRGLDPQSRTVRTFEKKRMKAREMLDAENGHPPSHQEIATRMGVTLARYDHLCRLSQLGKEVHFSAMEPSHDANGRGPSRTWDVGDKRIEDPTAGISREMLTEYITRGLSREERLVLVLYYYEELTMSEIGSVLNLSESRVSQIHKDILQRLRHRFGRTLCEELVA